MPALPPVKVRAARGRPTRARSSVGNGDRGSPRARLLRHLAHAAAPGPRAVQSDDPAAGKAARPSPSPKPGVRRRPPWPRQPRRSSQTAGRCTASPPCSPTSRPSPPTASSLPPGNQGFTLITTPTRFNARHSRYLASPTASGTPSEQESDHYAFPQTGVVAGIDDHIVPWPSAYRATQLLGGNIRFVLSTSGHVASMVNPPSNPTATFRLAPGNPPDHREWLAQADTMQGS